MTFELRSKREDSNYYLLSSGAIVIKVDLARDIDRPRKRGKERHHGLLCCMELQKKSIQYTHCKNVVIWILLQENIVPMIVVLLREKTLAVQSAHIQQ